MRISLELQPCCGNRSGIGIYTFELAKRLSNTKNISFHGNIFNFLNRNDNSSVIESLPFSVESNPVMPYGVYRRVWRCLPLSYENFFQESDISHFFNYIVPPKVKGKVITTVYDMSYRRYPETLDQKNLRRITQDINYSIDRSDIIITISENTKKEIIEEFGISEEKVKIVYPSFDTIDSNQSFQMITKKFNIPTKYILYVGNLEPRKNIDVLIKAFAALKKETDLDYHLVIAGQKGWLYESIFKTVEALGISRYITFTGYISTEDKSALYKNASLFLYPSLYEGFGIPILEAMSSGVPVICSNTSSMPEVVGDAALLIRPDEPVHIAEAMHSMLTSADLREEKIRLGYLQAEKFSWDTSAEKLMGLYNEIGSTIE